MTLKKTTLAATALLLSSTFAFAQSKPSCDEIANPKAGDNCDDLAGAASSGGDFLTGAGPLLLLLGVGGVLGGGGTSGTTGTGPSAS